MSGRKDLLMLMLMLDLSMQGGAEELRSYGSGSGFAALKPSQETGHRTADLPE